MKCYICGNYAHNRYDFDGPDKMWLCKSCYSIAGRIIENNKFIGKSIDSVKIFEYLILIVIHGKSITSLFPIVDSKKDRKDRIEARKVADNLKKLKS